MQAPSGCANLAMFSPRERQIVASLTAAQQVSEIALTLHLTKNTVKSYIKGIYVKAGVHSARELMLKFPPMPRAADDRRGSLNRVLATTETAQLHGAVLAMLCEWTGARRAQYWEVAGDDAGRLPHPYIARSSAYAPATACADGPVLIAPREVARDSFLRAAFAGRPLQGEVCLMLLRLQKQKWLLALADPAAGSFAPEILKLVQALARLAEHHAESFTTKAAAPFAAESAQRREV